MSEAASDSINQLSELTLKEKASLCLGSHFWYTAPVERLGIPLIMVSDGPHGLRAQPGEGDHVGIAGSVPATCFPTASALASSWNSELFRTIGEALGREAKKLGVSVVLGPGINMKRSPLCGRNLSISPKILGWPVNSPSQWCKAPKAKGWHLAEALCRQQPRG